MANVLGDDHDPADAVVDGAYYRASGTSFAAPIVTGTVSLILAAHPEYTPADVRRVLMNSTRENDLPGVDQLTGNGFLDAAAAITADPEFYLEASIADVGVVREDGAAYLQVLGTASADRLQRAVVSIGPGEDPNDWTIVGKVLVTPVENGVLAQIEADHFRESPQWTLRLVTRHQNGREREARFKLSLN